MGALAISEFDLARAGKRIQHEMAEIARIYKDCDQRRIALGRELMEIKASLAHGEWQVWLKKNGIVDSTARLYMRLARGDETPDGERTRVREGMRKTRTKTSSRDDVLPDDEDTDDIEADLDESPENFRTAFLLRADQATRFATYTGPIDNEIVLAAAATAKAWSTLAATLRNSVKR